MTIAKVQPGDFHCGEGGGEGAAAEEAFNCVLVLNNQYLTSTVRLETFTILNCYGSHGLVTSRWLRFRFCCYVRSMGKVTSHTHGLGHCHGLNCTRGGISVENNSCTERRISWESKLRRSTSWTPPAGNCLVWPPVGQLEPGWIGFVANLLPDLNCLPDSICCRQIGSSCSAPSLRTFAGLDYSAVVVWTFVLRPVFEIFGGFGQSFEIDLFLAGQISEVVHWSLVVQIFEAVHWFLVDLIFAVMRLFSVVQMSVVVRWFLVVQRPEPAQIFVAVQSPEVVQTAEVDFDSVQLSGVGWYFVAGLRGCGLIEGRCCSRDPSPQIGRTSGPDGIHRRWSGSLPALAENPPEMPQSSAVTSNPLQSLTLSWNSGNRPLVETAHLLAVVALHPAPGLDQSRSSIYPSYYHFKGLKAPGKPLLQVDWSVLVLCFEVEILLRLLMDGTSTFVGRLVCHCLACV